MQALSSRLGSQILLCLVPLKWFMKRCHAAFVPEHVPPATLANNASPLVILVVLHEELTKRGDRVYIKLVN